ncbi:DNA-binding response regulator [Endozoicomonas sp. OPT23]|uniref:sigma-54-dependent transcriptional regulator n=1 Tax=Endozoicomonas sp. OPT23 TaxID=2072845 RepID=UPI00129A736E|nr:sigma-54 dependent transcriptional regulator [Endozoicomonas sp. OPT23]MRI35189.1 DNA-binding response regulator [Endozoicomonas sp. OPT23]
MKNNTSANAIKVIAVDDDKAILNSLSQTFELADLPCQPFASANQALEHIEQSYIRSYTGVIVTDINMSPMDGLELMAQVHAIDADIPVILITGHGDVSTAVNAMRDGAYDFIEKPFTNKHLVSVVQRALERRRLIQENRQLRVELEAQSAPGPRILGNTPGIRQLRNQIHQVLDTPADILIHGETGTGKELVARSLHELSSRRSHPFVAINCGAVPENLIESELFGHVAGAFTGAEKKRVGKFEHANKGTLFLDEIESMPMSLQVKILRVLEERAVEPLGTNSLVPLDIRIIAATKTDLLELTDQGEFRQDLYYRLNLVTLNIPPLRDRLKDVPLLFEHFALIAAARYQRTYEPPSAQLMDSLLQHHWPGNVRELRNTAERHVITGGMSSFVSQSKDANQEIQARNSLPERIDQFERMIIEQTLKDQHGRIKDTMVDLGIARKTLYDKMKKHGLEKDLFKQN